MGIFLAGIFGVLSLVVAVILSISILKRDQGTERMKKIAKAIQDGALAFLLEEYKTMYLWVVVFAIVIGVVISPYVAIFFVLGTIFSTLSGFFGMYIATRASVRTTNAAMKSTGEALFVAFSGGSVMGLTVTGLGIIGSLITYLVSSKYFPGISPLVAVTGYSIGASFVALFARVGGGIYTKAADVGADLVGKVEAGIPEDDPRNPAVIADNVGDNVGDIAGMGADLYESYVGSITAAIILGVLALGNNAATYIYLIVGYGILSSIIGVASSLIASKLNIEPQKALNLGSVIANIIAIIIFYFVSKDIPNGISYFVSIITGLLIGLAIGFITQYYTSSKPIIEIAKSASEGGAATTILSGMAVGMESTFIPLLLIAIGIIISYHFSGLFGIALAGLGMLATLGISLSVDAYGPIADNAGGIAEMSHLPHEVRGRTDTLDALGNTTAAMGKGFAIGSAALTALALFSSYIQTMGMSSLDIMSPYTISGMFIGTSLPFLFSALAIMAVSRTAGYMVEEVRRQFREIPGLISGKADPDYKKCVAISTKGALKSMILPSLIAVISPFAGLIIFMSYGKEFTGGLLAGAVLSGVIIAIYMANAGASWDNAKKYIEQGNFGGKGSEAHRASVVGDTVGDPLKDTAGPSINILIKLMTTISLLFGPYIVKLILK
ncbi:MAG: sodium-translocating pyrophosphatase [Caldisericum exile]|uniref:sodium-translocating pyrophosphatase n=1 Tax=Caldisericum exile TaxID=693075 RepID=UPI003C724F79